jgi:dUTP pyrophosphatase
MHLPITLVDTTLPLPEYGTAGSVGFDLYARVETVVAPKSLGFIPSNVIVATPPGHVFFVASRSSTPRKKGLLIPHGIGVVDQDYCGPKDEILIQVYNFTDQPVTVARSERIAQGLLMPIERPELVHTATTVAAESRGGIGSTGS